MTKNNEILKVFGKNVRDFRLEQGISQEQLAELSGLHRTYIGMIERAEKNITLINANKVAKALGIGITKLLPDDK
ncbi:helix-turn-helix domain-containing protein [Flavihumibacter stibioxidans]|uniref:Transcriptional regulator n=1 Tax=Flavihumibacter stibioxidans TaxID=1834163 RepID=A0ABR7M6M7_9BACT|nr:helix-turn-helix transcriptional regulator [Flavihumibacter stibioxidans]MBC6490669.1 transcriptional regulator [Flavihumibacter stibioxidans]